MPPEIFEKLCTEMRPYIQKNKSRLGDPISVEKQMAARLYYLVDEGRMQILLVSGNQQFQKLSGFFCFYFKKIFPFLT